VISLMLGKALIITFLCRLFGTPLFISLRTGLALSQGGEFGFVIFGAALTLGLLPKDLTQILMAVIAITMILTPGMFTLGKRISDRLEERGAHGQSEQVIDIEGTEQHVLIAGFGRVGQTIAKILSDAGIAYIAIDLDQDLVQKCRAKGLRVYFGNADRIEVLKSAGAGRAKAAVITIDNAVSANLIVSALRNNYVDLQIYVRAKDRKHMHLLEKSGANAVVSEAAESSLQLGSIVLKSLNISVDEITSLIEDYREDDYAKLEEIISGK